MQRPNLFGPEIEAELLHFAQHLVSIKSISGEEEEIIAVIEKKMHDLGYDAVTVDSMGNVIGRVGEGNASILFDSHVDTVDVQDEGEWRFPPFSGKIVDGNLWGRGSVDMKSGVAASIYAGALAKEKGLASKTALYVSCTVMEEDCDGENLKHLFKEYDLKPNNVVICEPSGNQITLGHKGKAQVSIKTHGVSAHGSAPEMGVNAIYEMAEIIQRVDERNANLMKKNPPRGTLVMSTIASKSASLNAVPSECEVYLDRRLVPGDTEDHLQKEMENLIRGKRATWKVGTLIRRSWTGMKVQYEPFHLAWEIDKNHELTQNCIAAYQKVFGCHPSKFDFWDFSTNAVTPVRLGIPTIGFGPGEYKLAHMRNEHCDISQIVDACAFYAQLALCMGS
jgi:putative selenium metabolism hydrolase